MPFIKFQHAANSNNEQQLTSAHRPPSDAFLASNMGFVAGNIYNNINKQSNSGDLLIINQTF